jgi:hypothetical protein
VQAENYARNFLGAIFVAAAMKKVNHGKISRDTICIVKRAMPRASRFKVKAFEGCAMTTTRFQFDNQKRELKKDCDKAFTAR